MGAGFFGDVCIFVSAIEPTAGRRVGGLRQRQQGFRTGGAGLFHLRGTPLRGLSRLVFRGCPVSRLNDFPSQRQDRSPRQRCVRNDSLGLLFLLSGPCHWRNQMKLGRAPGIALAVRRLHLACDLTVRDGAGDGPFFLCGKNGIFHEEVNQRQPSARGQPTSLGQLPIPLHLNKQFNGVNVSCRVALLDRTIDIKLERALQGIVHAHGSLVRRFRQNLQALFRRRLTGSHPVDFEAQQPGILQINPRLASQSADHALKLILGVQRTLAITGFKSSQVVIGNHFRQSELHQVLKSFLVSDGKRRFSRLRAVEIGVLECRHRFRHFANGDLHPLMLDHPSTLEIGTRQRIDTLEGRRIE